MGHSPLSENGGTLGWLKTESAVPRTEGYLFLEAEGNNELPERGITGRDVAEYWCRTLTDLLPAP